MIRRVQIDDERSKAATKPQQKHQAAQYRRSVSGYEAAALQRPTGQLSLIALALLNDGERMVEMIDCLAQPESLQQLFTGQHRVARELVASAASRLPKVEGCFSRVGD